MTEVHSSKKTARSVKKDKSTRSNATQLKNIDSFNVAIDDSEFKKFSTPLKDIGKVRKELICDLCYIPLVVEDQVYICTDCGYSKDIIEEQDVIYTNSNNNQEATNTLRIIGSCAKEFQRHHIQTTSDYSKRKKLDSKSEFERHFHRYKKEEAKTGHFAPPWHVFEQASELFDEVQKLYTKRATKRRGVHGACIFYEARRAGMAKEEKLIARIVGVSETALHSGMDLLESLHREGVIDIPLISTDDDERSRITQFCNQLNIDLKYVPFIYDFVELAINKHIGDESESKSKCVGTIYFLAKIKNISGIFENLDKCDISKPTYQRFFNEICQKHKKFKALYDKYEDVIGISYKRAKKKVEKVR